MIGLSRSTAAHLLNSARNARGPGRHEMAGWAATVLPDSRGAVRLHARSLIELDDLPAAAALLARGQLQHPSDPTFAALWAEVLLARGRVEEAAAELAPALARRPSHGRTLELAGDIARAAERPSEAVEHYERAFGRHLGRCLRVREKLVHALLAAGRTARAAALVEPDSPLLRGRVLRAQGRLRDAADELAAALDQTPPPASADRLQAELIDILESRGDVPRLRDHVETPIAGPRATVRAARALLGLGRFADAARLVIPLARGHDHSAPALHVLVVAAALDGRRGLARRALERIGRTGGIDRALMADCWRRGLSGRVLAAKAGRVAADRSPSLLAPMLRRAVAAFEAAAAGPPETDETGDLDRHRALCAAATPQPHIHSSLDSSLQS